MNPNSPRPGRARAVARHSLLAAVIVLAAGCASKQVVPMKVQSDPLGAFVLMKYKGADKAESDWIYLGSTPLTTQRRFSKDVLDDDHVLVLRMLKEGYAEQIKEWRGSELERFEGESDPLFWNPKLVNTQ